MKKVPNTQAQKDLEALRIKFEKEENRNEIKTFDVDDVDRLIDFNR